MRRLPAVGLAGSDKHGVSWLCRLDMPKENTTSVARIFQYSVDRFAPGRRQSVSPANSCRNRLSTRHLAM
jgi:hypothetical protein